MRNLTRMEAISLLKGVRVVVVANQYDFNGRSYCRVFGFHNSEEANGYYHYLMGSQDYDCPEVVSPELAIKLRNNIGANKSTNIEDNWETEPVGLSIIEILD